MPQRVVKSPQALQQVVTVLANQPLPLTISWVKGEKRTDAQNNTIHIWFRQISDATGQTPLRAKAVCKWDLGRPILLEQNPAWTAKYRPLWEAMPTYEMRINLFEFLPVTSVMTVGQQRAFMDAMQHQYLPRGIPLVDPEARKYEGEFT